MFIEAKQQHDKWNLTNRWGHSMQVPALADDASSTVQIGTLGTRFVAPPGVPKTKLMARMLKGLQRPLILIDTRRTGVGGMGAWGPLEFATLIPELIGSDTPCDFIHLPELAPTVLLLDADRSGKLGGWRAFRERYNAGLGDSQVALARAWAEAASVRGGLAIFICAEAWCANFKTLDAQAQHAAYCHRFSLVHRVAASLRADHPGVPVERVDLDATAFAAQLQAGQAYQPHLQRL